MSMLSPCRYLQSISIIFQHCFQQRRIRESLDFLFSSQILSVCGWMKFLFFWWKLSQSWPWAKLNQVDRWISFSGKSWSVIIESRVTFVLFTFIAGQVRNFSLLSWKQFIVLCFWTSFGFVSSSLVSNSFCSWGRSLTWSFFLASF